MIAEIPELMSGVWRHFPNTIIMSLLVAGILLARMSWIVIGLGGIVTAVITLVIQYVVGKTGFIPGGNQIPGGDIMRSCSLLPTTGDSYSKIPSLWVALTTFLTTYIITNAAYVASAPPAGGAANTAIPVQQRKGVGVISILAIIILFLFMMFFRFKSPCESTLSMILGSAIGILMGYTWWGILYACGSNTYPDIHGVMLGLAPGSLRTSPLACTPPPS
jgi:hypothetical protein